MNEAYPTRRMEIARDRLRGGMRGLLLGGALFIGSEIVSDELNPETEPVEEASFVEKYADDPLRGGAIVLSVLGMATVSLGFVERWDQTQEDSE